MEEPEFASEPTSTFDGLAGKNVLVTGGSSGIGQSIAVRFGHEGANVAINYLSDRGEAEATEEQIQAAYDRCARQIEDCGVEVSLHQADVSSEDDVTRMFEEAIDELGSIDVLVNNAGIQISGASHALDTADFDTVIAVNLRGAYLCARAALRHWVDMEADGTIINVSSVHQLIPKPQFVGYSASKGGMQNLTRTLALEYADRGIRVNAIGPGATITPINSAWVEDPEKKAMVEDHIPMGRAGRSEEMAAIAAFLASDEAAYVTGQTLYVDGGLTLYPDFRTTWSSE
jgi:glucose 1-dehydrogenase